jgi:hypothetical protein
MKEVAELKSGEKRRQKEISKLQGKISELKTKKKNC